jgi:hypothetical protein
MATLATFFRSSTADAAEAGRSQAMDYDPFELRALPNDHIYFYSKRIDNSRMVRQANPAASQESWSAVGAVAILLMLGCSIIAPHVASVLAGYKLEALKSERQALVDQGRSLSVREATLLSPSRLVDLASAHKLSSPGVDQIVHLDNVASDVSVASARPVDSGFVNKDVQ